jgi:hypothetical protein
VEKGEHYRDPQKGESLVFKDLYAQYVFLSLSPFHHAEEGTLMGFVNDVDIAPNPIVKLDNPERLLKNPRFFAPEGNISLPMYQIEEMRKYVFQGYWFFSWRSLKYIFESPEE